MWVRQADFTDCEVPDDWFLAQDVNAASSLSYVIAGLVIAVAVVRRRVPRVFVAMTVALTIEGVGSVLYHGDPGEIAQLLHDAALVATLGFVTGWHVGRLARRADTGALSGLVLGFVAGAVGAATSTVVTNGFVAGAVIVLVVAELLARRRGYRAVWNGGAIALLGLALLSWVLGAPDSPVCDAQAWAQPHALWHILSALVVLAWVDRASTAAAPTTAEVHHEPMGV
jgi:hypothetical protein